MLTTPENVILQNSICLLGCNIQVRQFTLTKMEKRKEYYGRKLVGFSMEQMYRVVSDVSNYRKFVPFCKRSTVTYESHKRLRAELQIGFPPICESYTSDVQLSKPHLVRAVCTDGRLFNYLETCWKFSPGLQSNPQSCIVDFSIDFEFKSKLHYQLANMFFETLVKQMEGAFMLEAKRRYGRESVPTHKLAYIKS
ncbi:Polyketide cyclase / dehydrase and lipid transport [Popillia japonica]|uniref:Polyketide cyclase / dehydrase and lipid transport n=1 Tax=Popillia japonica TaxID=7064 RepID=A0AAW1LZ38_POPJA